MSHLSSPLRSHLAAVVATLLTLVPRCNAQAQFVTLSPQAVGPTPSVLGFNSGHFLPGSNTGSWWKFAGVNGGRIFSSPSYLTPGTSTYFRSESTSTLNASTEAQFISQRAALRASGTATTYIRWDRIAPLYMTGTVSGNNAIQLKYAEDTMHGLGIAPLIVMTRSPASYPWPSSPAANAAADWQDRWLAWQQWYAQAFIHARENGVENYQFFNEPDLYGSLSQEQWLEMVQFGANAVECAVADVNRLYDKSLTPHVYGPVTTGPETAVGGWGDTLLASRHNKLFSGFDPSYQLFDHYDYHNYGTSPTGFGTKVADTIAAIDAATGGAAEDYPVVLSEFNTRTSGNYDPADPINNPNGYTPDSPAMSSRLGQILANVATNGVDELYLFKFSNAGGAFNGVYWQSESGSKSVGGATRSAMTYQLFTQGFCGTTLLASPQSSDTDLTMAAAADVEAGRRYAFITNENGSQAKVLSLDLTSWNVSPGSTVTVKQVSGLHQGDISQIITVPDNRTVNVMADPFGVVLVTAPTVSGLERIAITASADATVREGTATTNDGTAASLVVRSGSTTATHQAAFLKFSVGDLDPALLFDATLSITAFDPGATAADAAGIVCHVYGITDTSWQETTTGTVPGITWANAPNISQSSRPAARTTIDQNYVTGVGTTADILGQFAATGTAESLSVDVSGWIADRLAGGQSSVSFLITRDVRFDGDIDGSHMLSITSREGAAGTPSLAPTLTLATFTKPITIDVRSGSLTQLQTGNSSIRGTSPVMKTGVGTLVLDVPNTTTGSTTVQAGELRLTNPLALASSPTVVLPGGRLTFADDTAAHMPSVDVRGGTLLASSLVVGTSTGIGRITIDSGRLDGRPSLAVVSGGRVTMSPESPLMLAVTNLTVDASSGALVDIGMGGLAIAAGGITPEAIDELLAIGRNAGDWNGDAGIRSSAAAAAVAAGRPRTVGWIEQDDGSILCRLAAPGDSNLDGFIDVLDLATVLAGGRFNAGGPCRWADGDFNNDGLVDIIDVADMMSTGLFNAGDYLAATTADEQVAPVPEPTGLSAVLVAAASWTVRRARRRPEVVGLLGTSPMALPPAGPGQADVQFFPSAPYPRVNPQRRGPGKGSCRCLFQPAGSGGVNQ
jgi:autotransporter-associated beta strand protein